MALQTAQAQSPKLAKHRTWGSEQKTKLPHARKGSWTGTSGSPGQSAEQVASENVPGSASLSEEDSSAFSLLGT